jgi:hypothetical protein
MSDNKAPSTAVEPPLQDGEPQRIYSHLDDQSVCHGHHGHDDETQAGAWNRSMSTESLSSREDVEKELSGKPRASGDSQEGQDLERGLPVEKSRTLKGVQDPNIVSPPPAASSHFALLTGGRLAGDVGRSR